MLESDFDLLPESELPKEKRQGVRLGIFLWLVFVIATGVVLWLLVQYFPGHFTSDDDQIDLVRLLAILALVSSGLLHTRWIDLGVALRNIAIWVGLAALLMLGYSYQDDLKSVGERLRAELLPGQPVEMSPGKVELTKGQDGHFHANALADNVRIQFMIDTGASDIVLSPADATRIGIDLSQLSYTIRYQTANGPGRGARYRLAILSIGSIEFRDVAISVNQAEMDGSLLGMSFFERLTSFEIRGRKLIMQR